MKYMGSKNRIAKFILPIMIKEVNEKGITTWAEPFVGGANMIDKVPNNLQRIGIDYNAHTIEALVAIRDLVDKLPNRLSEDKYKQIKGSEPESFSANWYNVCSGKKFAPVEYLEMFSEDDLKGVYQLPMKFLKPLKEQFPDLQVLGMTSKTDANFVVIKPNQILIDKVIDAMGKLNSTRYTYRFDNPKIEYVKFFNQGTLGLANDGRIYLSTKLDSYSVDEIAKIIIEENEHNLTGLDDETRGFQNHLFNLYFCELTEK